MDDFDIRGRLIAQAMYSEMEKIAGFSQKARQLSQEAVHKVNLHKKLQDALGWKRFVPFTQSQRAASASRARASAATAEAEAQVKKERGAAARVIESGKGNQEEMLRMLGEGKPTYTKRSRLTGPKPAPEIPPDKKPLLSTKNLIIGGTGLAVGGAGLYAGKKYLDGQSDPYGQAYYGG